MDAMRISRTGLDVEWQRLQVIAQNLASANVSRTDTGTPARAMRLVTAARGDFAAAVSRHGTAAAPAGVAVLGMEPVAGGIRRVYQPGDADAGLDGYVTYPAIDHAAEMTLLIRTSRLYEANLTAMNIAHQMYSRALELGRQS